MIDHSANPPRIAQMLLHTGLSSRDAETIAGNLLEEYRAVRRPSLGRLRADAWYAGHVLSVVWRLVWPFALALVVARVIHTTMMAFPLSGGWNPSLIPAPNVALLDAMMFLAAGYAAARRTGRLVTGVVNAGVLGLIDFAMFAAYALFLFPTLPSAIREKPFILVIGFVYLAIAVMFALAFGAAGAAVGGWRASRLPRTGSA